MDTNKDYYASLGVLPESEPEIIRAVYLALAKKYHPDSAGNTDNVERMKEINAAYEILNDFKKRTEYNAARSEQKYNMGEYEPDVDDDELVVDDLQNDWNFAVDYRPELANILKEVASISPTLSIVFQSTVLRNKAFNNAVELKDNLILSFLNRFFGDSIAIQNFAKQLLVEKEKLAVKELNKAIKIFGNKISSADIIEIIKNKYQIKYRSVNITESEAVFISEYKKLDIYQCVDKYFMVCYLGEMVIGSKKYLNEENARNYIDYISSTRPTT